MTTPFDSSNPASVFSTVLDELHHILLALVGGARYGVKIRLPHALVMTFLFRNDLTAREKLRSVLRLAAEHATNLAAFATIYKTLLAALKWSSVHLRASLLYDDVRNGILKGLGKKIITSLVDGPFPGEVAFQRLTSSSSKPPGHPEYAHHALLAGAVGGYFVWGRYSSVNYQIVLYLTSRVIVGVAKRLVLGGRSNIENDVSNQMAQDRQKRLYSVAAALVWGLVMMLFEESPDVLHPSLKNSMDEIYRYRLPRSLSSVGEVISAKSRKHPPLKRFYSMPISKHSDSQQ